MKTLRVLLLLMLCASFAFGQGLVKEVSGSTYPQIEKTFSTVGFHALYPDSAWGGVDMDNRLVAQQLSRLQISAVTDAEFNIWTYTSRWSRLMPGFHIEWGDSTVTLSADSSEWYYFPNSRPKAIYMKSGSIKVKGE